MPANLAWMPTFGNDFGVAENWVHISTGLVSDDPPAQGDSLTFDGRSDADCVGMYGFGADPMFPDYASFRLLSGYDGTVTLATGVSTDVFTLQSGSIAQGGSSANLSVSSTFTWTGGVLNNTPSNATVAILGGGQITLGGPGTTLTAGSTLAFGNLNPAGVVTTIISGAGDLLLNTTNDNAVFVGADTKVELTVVGVDSEQKLKAAGAKKVVLNPRSEWRYTGAGTRDLELAVENVGGWFDVGGLGGPGGGSLVEVRLKGGGGGTPGYLQKTSADTKLHIMTGCTLDLVGVEFKMESGSLFIRTNPDATAGMASLRVANLRANMTITGGDIVFDTPPQVDGAPRWTTLSTQGPVSWSGGTYRPGINAQSDEANLWKIAGTLTINADGPVKPHIQHILQFPQAQLPSRTWTVVETVNPPGLETGKIEGPNPTFPDGTSEDVNGFKIDSRRDSADVKRFLEIKRD
ncbi:MAG: hypothetical protein C0501_30630, partial [Isosphaera sp.]|nr:hypothetical protein [Isosphaera sp.]